jgi:hypothetical protein
MELASGDRVIVTEDQPQLDLPEGTLGTVVEVGDAEIDIDFATWGRLRSGIGETVSRFLRHDYVAVESQRDMTAADREPLAREAVAATSEVER